MSFKNTTHNSQNHTIIVKEDKVVIHEWVSPAQAIVIELPKDELTKALKRNFVKNNH